LTSYATIHRSADLALRRSPGARSGRRLGLELMVRRPRRPASAPEGGCARKGNARLGGAFRKGREPARRDEGKAAQAAGVPEALLRVQPHCTGVS
jgi:hypothetical protein